MKQRPSHFGMAGVFILVLLAFTPAALAHVAKLSSSQLNLTADGLSAEVKVNVVDIQFVLKDVIKGRPIADKNKEVDAEALAKHADRVSGYILDKIAVRSENNEPCSATPLGAPKAYAEKVDIEQVVLRVRWTCPGGTTGLSYKVTLFQEVDQGARHIVLITEGDEQRHALIDTENTEVPLTKGAITLGDVFVRYLYSGVEHIWIGYDHIAFIVAVVLWGRHLWPLFKVVSAFTVAHSITLTLAVLGIVKLPSSFVEAAIAATIVYVAAENFFIRNLDRRWRMTFALGLVHGLGFASVLRDYGLPPDALTLALASFNIGVEIGQLAIVTAAVGVMILLDQALSAPGDPHARSPAFVYAVSGVIGVLGLFWLAERTVLA